MNFIFYFLSLLTFGAITYSLYYNFSRLLSRKSRIVFLSGIFITVFFSFCFYWVYTYAYSNGDTLLYRESAQLIANALYHQNEFYLIESDADLFSRVMAVYEKTGHVYSNNSLFIIRITAALQLLSFNSLFMLIVMFATFSFITKWELYKFFLAISKSTFLVSFLAAFGVPTFVFWTTGVLKDTLFVGCFIMLLVGIFKKSYFWLFISILSSLLLFYLRSYGLFIFCFSFFLYKIVQMIVKKPNLKTGGVLLGFISLVCLVAYIFNDYLFDRIATFHKWHSILATRGQYGYDLGKFEYTYLGVFLKVPEAIFYTLYKPFFWEASNFFQWIVSVEKALLTGLFFLAIFHIKKIKNIAPVALLLLFFVLFFATALGITTYNYGALSRYSTILLPFYTFLILEITFNKS